MLKKMRWRVILAAMLSFSAVILLIAALVNIVNYYVVTGTADRTLEAVFEQETRPAGPITGMPPTGMPGTPVGTDVTPPGGMMPSNPNGQGEGTPPGGPFMIFPDVEANYMMRFFVVRFDSDGDVYSVSTDYIASVDEEQAMEYGRQVLKKSSNRGFYKDYRYLKRDANGLTVIIFLNVSRELISMRSLLFQTLGIAGGSLVLVFILVVLLSGRAVRPIAKNIEQQKQFITDASHELKTPLTSISASLDVIAMEHGEDEWTENIRKQTGRMAKLVSELVTLSRLDEEMPLPNKENFSLSNAAWEIAEVYEPQAKAKGKKMTVDIEDNINLFGEKNAIQQMFSVLLDNAIRYSDEKGEIRFTVRKKKSKVLMEVFNTCQMDVLPDVNRLFERFYRPDSSRNTETGGTGVGMSIARAVAEAHGGSISAKSPSGKTMTIQILI